MRFLILAVVTALATVAVADLERPDLGTDIWFGFAVDAEKDLLFESTNAVASVRSLTFPTKLLYPYNYTTFPNHKALIRNITTDVIPRIDDCINRGVAELDPPKGKVTAESIKAQSALASTSIQNFVKSLNLAIAQSTSGAEKKEIEDSLVVAFDDLFKSLKQWRLALTNWIAAMEERKLLPDDSEEVEFVKKWDLDAVRNDFHRRIFVEKP